MDRSPVASPWPPRGCRGSFAHHSHLQAMIGSRAQRGRLLLTPTLLASFPLAPVWPHSAFCSSGLSRFVLCNHLEQGLSVRGWDAALAWGERGLVRVGCAESKTPGALPWLGTQTANSPAGRAGRPARGRGALPARKGSTLQPLGQPDPGLCSLIGTWVHRWEAVEMIWISPLSQIPANNHDLLTERQDEAFHIELRPISPGVL